MYWTCKQINKQINKQSFILLKKKHFDNVSILSTPEGNHSYHQTNDWYSTTDIDECSYLENYSRQICPNTFILQFDSRFVCCDTFSFVKKSD